MDSVLATRFWTAIKTGTSKDMRDNWAVGYSRDYTVGVWVGNASGGSMWDVSGTAGAAPVWAAVMDYLHRDQPGAPPTPPAGLVRQRVTFEDAAGQGLEAARDEWFIAGTEQARIVLLLSSNSEVAARAGNRLVAHIASPTDGTILALDPDIPPQAQRVSLHAVTSDTTQGLTWRIDGKALSQGQTAQWLPWPGTHRVSLTDDTGRILDQIALEVRGASINHHPARAGASR
jgi:penicillin-binding protein 1C